MYFASKPKGFVTYSSVLKLVCNSKKYMQFSNMQ